MKIVHFIDSSGLYGADQVVISLVNQLVLKKNDVYLFNVSSLHIDNNSYNIDGRVNIVNFPISYGNIILRIIFLRRKLNNLSPDVIHTHNYKPDIILSLIKLIMFKDIKLVCTLHGWTNTDNKYLSRYFYYRILDKISLMNFDSIVAVSHSIKDQLPKFLQQKTTVIINSINLPDPATIISDNSMFSYLENFEFNILFVGRLSSEKGVIQLAHTAKQLNDIKASVTYIGDGELFQHLTQYVKENQLQNIFLKGYISNPVKYFSMFDCLCLPSFTEGTPIVLLESLNQGLPVIASSVGSIPEILDNGEYGYLLEDNTPENITKGIKTMKENIIKYTKKASNWGEYYGAKYSPDNMIAEYMALYS